MFCSLKLKKINDFLKVSTAHLNAGNNDCSSQLLRDACFWPGEVFLTFNQKLSLIVLADSCYDLATLLIDEINFTSKGELTKS